ncbi:predicted protein [Nematostella vectensis]|uniref:Glutamate-rich WD repeat-containing protein 1 n=1 Tax=Nematostella vectensis TaxID=45351 RepID=A7SMS9_NEMVE|nr:predicted protein [Nematostella vectensis]|eukprot:XP_001627080.1 predicted protein [Nematostella vectensis]
MLCIYKNSFVQYVFVCSQVFLPGDAMEQDEELTYDSTAYHMYHAAQTGAPCLSFDVIPDNLGEARTEYPMTAYILAGTQSERSRANHIIVMKMSELHRTHDEEKDSDEEEDDYIDEDPELETVMLKHNGGVNRIRHGHIPNRHIVASWSERGSVHIWDVEAQIIASDNPGSSSQPRESSPLFTFSGHASEGFAMDWSRNTHGRLLTGDCKHNVHLWNPQEGGSWHVDQRPFNAHTDSVEDVQWSPNENNVFASCSVDKTIRIWDARAMPSKACMISTNAHDADVNVISWNRNEPFIVSGGDDGILKVWDLRQLQKQGQPVALFKHSTGPITSVEWHPTDGSVFAASSADNQITLWDLAVERDEAAEGPGRHLDVPPQLLFIHMGQKDIKELHWHPQLPGVLISTAESGFNIFKTISV